MRKTLLFTFALLCTVVQGTWAQTAVSSEEQLIEAVKNDGKNIKLNGDITLHDPIDITVSVTIDLNNHIIEFEQLMGHANDYACLFAVTSSGTLNLKGGTIANAINKSARNTDFNAGAIVNKGKVNLENVTFSNCSGLQGGAIRNHQGATLTITSCAFDGNNASSGSTEGSGTGGAIWNAGTLTVTGTSFSNNSSINGGVIWNSGSITLSDDSFTSNKADNQAAGIFNSGVITITSCTFDKNSSADASAIYHAGMDSQSTSKVSSCTFTSNNSVGGGGTIRTAPNAHQLVIDQSTSFKENVSTQGAAIYCESKVVVDGVSMTDNESNSDGGAIFVSTTGNATIKNASTFSNNTAGEKGGAVCNNGTVTSDKSSISGNIAGLNGSAISNNGTFTVTGGTIEKSNCTEKYEGTNDSGSAIFNYTGATITLNGVTISENTTARSGGSAILNWGGNATLTDCTIKDNSNNSNGGAIWTNGKTTISGGSISGNKATNTTGAIFVADGNTDITDCNITGNESPDCGAVWNNENGTVTITNGSISNNNVTKKGAGAICNHGTFNINNVSITGNTCKDTGAGIWNNGELNINGATIQNNTGNSYGGGINNEGTLRMQGKVIISDNKQGDQKNNVYLHDGKVIEVKGSLVGSKIFVDMENIGVFTSGYKSNNTGTDPNTIFTSDRDAFFEATLSGNEATMSLKPLITVDNDADLRTARGFDGANIQLANDIKLSNNTLSIPEGTTVTIDLNGHTLDRALTKRGEGGGQVITVRKGATLNLSNGTLKGGWGGDSGGINNEAGTANLTDVTITGCTGDDRGGGIVNRSGSTLTMTGGSISGNTSRDAIEYPSGGGGIFNAEGATATLTGVTITGNEAKGYGGGGINNFGKLTIDGCTITGNTSKENGGAIWTDAGSTLNMQGKLTISDNQGKGKVNNVYLREGALITVTGSLEGSKIGIGMAKPDLFTSGYSANNDKAPITYFVADDSDYQIVLSDNEARLQKKMGDSIQGIDADEQGSFSNKTGEDGTCYDLSGRKVNSKSAKGIYIVNGKKMLK